MLRLVDDGAVGKLAQELCGLLTCKFTLRRGLQRDVGPIRQQAAHQRRLARLPRPGHGDDREALQQAQDAWRSVAATHPRNGSWPLAPAFNTA